MTLRSDIARAKELDAKATPGPWHLSDCDVPPIVYVHIVMEDGEVDEPPVAVVDDGTVSRIDVGEMTENAALIAHYRTLVPRMAEQIEVMEKALNALLIERGGMPKECGHFYECRCANDAARSALAALDKEEQ